VQLTLPPDKVPLHNVTLPPDVVKSTSPVGVPPVDVTVAAYVSDWPISDDAGTDAVVVVGA